jgi:glucose-6-phosphate isomerase
MTNWIDLIYTDKKSNFSIDLNFSKQATLEMIENSKWQKAHQELLELEQGEIANPDEKRMVGHYWLRNSDIAPSEEIKNLIISTKEDLKNFAKKIVSGDIKSSSGKNYKYCLLIGIGGSALGPQFIEQALAKSNKPLKFYYFDNTDPAGMADVVASIPELDSTLVLVISKSGGTRETRNGMLFAEKAWINAGLKPNQNFVAITQEGSALSKHAKSEKWLKEFPMWDWVGGRVSLWSAVGLLPALLMGIDIDKFLEGANYMDSLTREKNQAKNPSAILAGLWHKLGNAKGEKILVMLPYRDQLSTISKYCQQLIMESIGKELDRTGNKVNQGLYVLGNKGSTDQHSYIQQLREGPSNFIAHFIEVLSDKSSLNNFSEKEYLNKMQTELLEEDSNAGDYLSGFLQGTRQALYENDRASVTFTIGEVNAYSVGMLLALFERAVSIYASLINVNAYHQPGVEAGKKAAAEIIVLQNKLMNILKENPEGISFEDILRKFSDNKLEHSLYCILRRLGYNQRVACKSADQLKSNIYKLISNG